MAKKSAASKGFRKQKVKKPYLTKRDIIILCVLVAALIVGAILLFSYDDGALKVSDGRVVDAGENWLIVNGSNTAGRYRYFKLGEVGELDGFTRENQPLTDSNVNRFVFTPDGEDAGVDSVTVTCVHGKADAWADYAAETLAALSGNYTVSEVKQADGYTYFTSVLAPDTADEAEEEAPAQTEGESEAAPTEKAEADEAAEDDGEEPAAEAEAPVYTTSLNAYADAAHDSSIVVDVSATAESQESLPDEAALQALVEQALAAVTLEPAK